MCFPCTITSFHASTYQYTLPSKHVEFPLYSSFWALFGKKNNKKTNSNNSQSSPSSSSANAPRVINQGKFSVRQQIAMVRAYKAANSKENQVKMPKKFRKEKAVKSGNRTEDIIDDSEYVSVDYSDVKPPLVFIDGYNVIHYLVAEGERLPMDMEDARDSLVSDMCVLAGTNGWDIEIVFDAYRVKTPQKTEDFDGIRVTYTSGTESADNYIERRFMELHKEGYNNMMVCTDDRAIQLSACEGLGSMPVWMLAEELRIAYLQWELYEKRMEEVSERAMDQSTIEKSIPVETLEYMKHMLQLEMEAKQKAQEHLALQTNGTASDGCVMELKSEEFVLPKKESQKQRKARLQREQEIKVLSASTAVGEKKGEKSKRQIDIQFDGDFPF